MRSSKDGAAAWGWVAMGVAALMAAGGAAARPGGWLLGSPSGKVSHVSLGAGIFCDDIGWIVYVERAGLVEFKLNGKVDKVQKM